MFQYGISPAVELADVSLRTRSPTVMYNWRDKGPSGLIFGKILEVVCKTKEQISHNFVRLQDRYDL
jgi:hypothetical protein